MKSNNTYHHENLKQELIEAGVQFVAGHGPDALSMRKLAGLCSVSATAAYKHFKNKEELMKAIILHIETEFVAGLSSALEQLQEKDSKTRIVGLGKEYVKFMVENPVYFRFWMYISPRPLIPSIHLEEKVVPGSASMQLFLKTARAHLDDLKVPGDHQTDCIISMWAMVHGLSAMLVNGNLVYEKNNMDLVERILSDHMYFS